MSGATKILMGSGGVDLPSDDEFDNVSFLSHFDGSNNGTNKVFDDGSSSNHTITTVGDTPQGTFGPFARAEGEWSNYFDGDADYLSFPDSSDWDLGSGSYTVEAWVWGGAGITTSTFNNIVGQWSQTGGASTNSWLMEYTGNGSGSGVMVGYAVIGGTPIQVAVSATLTLPLSQWMHVALVRNGNAHNVYINGVAGATTTNTNAYDAGSGTVEIGGFSHSSLAAGNWDGYISNVRVVKGTAVYTSNFTPPTTPLTAISGTVLLTCQSNRFVDKSTSAHTATTQGVTKVTAFTPYLTSKVYDSAVNGASAYFDGSNDVVHLDASGSDFNFGTGDFTIEGWAYNEGTGHSSWAYPLAAGAMLQFYVYQHNRILFNMTYSEGGASAFALEGTPGGSGGSLALRQWYHWAVTKAGSNASVFINGTRNATDSSVSGTFSAPTGNMFVGAYNATPEYAFGGYLSGVRILKGTAAYDPTSSTCTVPTAPQTAVTNTKLLLNMADGQALDSAAQNNMTLKNAAVTSTTQEKFSTASLDLTASDAFVTFPASTTSFGSGNFTIEAWVYVEDVSAYNCIISYGDPIQFYVKSGTLECYAKPLTGTGNCLGPSSSISNDTWCHVAFVRNGTSLTAYVNGVGGTPVTFSDAALTAYTGTASIGIYNSGASSGSTLSFDGYIDDLRISHFARYTSNFTPTTEAFPDKGQ
jgi:hypothetical protein